MPEIILKGVPINFPFNPYQVQRDYMEKVIECLQTGTNGVLESPTGTGKTLSLLCSTLAWLLTKKAQVQAAHGKPPNVQQPMESSNVIHPSNNLNNVGDDMDVLQKLEAAASGRSWGVPKIIYASRTHSQLCQVMAELKRSHYNFMKAAILGSRDQLCIHPEVEKEVGNSNKMYMCRVKVLSKSCSFYSRVQTQKDHPDVKEGGIMDIEDLAIIGRKLKCCPYYLSKEMVEKADIIFMPYNYLLDPKARRANNIELHNTVIILDEAHNVEKMCEDAASIQLKSSDIATCVEEVTAIMKTMNENKNLGVNDMGDIGEDNTEQTFTIEDLATLKEILLKLEGAIDGIQINLSEGTTHGGDYIFILLEAAGITDGNAPILQKLLDDLIQFITTMSQKNGMSSRGSGLSIIFDMLTIVFSSRDPAFKEKVRRCYKVHVSLEEQKAQKGWKKADGWTSMTPSVNKNAKVVSYWCFNPGFGMSQVLTRNVHSIIMTSGTLAPLKPLISELGIPVGVRLENPHIIAPSQVYVKIVSKGPDNEPLISNYENRNNPKYIQSLGRTVLSFCPIIPDGLLIFFPSYVTLNKCQDEWQSTGIWDSINRIKTIFIEPRTKEEFNIVMNEYYAKINDPNSRGAIFMAVCRGKVSEGLDFADMNGRGVIITGLPFPPVKDPRVVLKRRYLEENRTRDNDILTGSEWYGLEATRAVNQAIGRVIRHKDDYGAILLCDSRFNDRRQRDQLSKWIQGHLKNMSPGFGNIVGELSRFFKEAERNLPKPKSKPEAYSDCNSPDKKSDILTRINSANNVTPQKLSARPAIKIENSNMVPSWSAEDYKSVNVKVEIDSFEKRDFLTGLKKASSSIDFNDTSSYYPQRGESSNSCGLVNIHKRTSNNMDIDVKPKKYKLVSNPVTTPIDFDSYNFTSVKKEPMSLDEQVAELPEDRMELLRLIKRELPSDRYKIFLLALSKYRQNEKVDDVLRDLETVFNEERVFYILKGMKRFFKNPTHLSLFNNLVERLVQNKSNN